MTPCPRVIERSIGARDSAAKVRLLFGARQTGKSTLLNRLTTPDTLAFNLQERRVRLEIERNPSAFTQTLEADRRNHLSVHVDEVQKVPDLLDEVQYLYDRSPERYAFLLAGSSARKLKTASANLLPGRAHLFHLCPLILPERKGCAAARVFPLPGAEGLDAGFPPAVIEEVLLYGNLPGVVQEPTGARSRTLESYVEV